MDWTAAIIVMVLILVLGSIITIFWWNLAAKVSPYEDEIERERERERRRREAEKSDAVVVIKRDELPPVRGDDDDDGGERPRGA